MNDVIVVAKDQVAADVGGELVILSVASGEYFGLNAVGSHIWRLISEQPRTVAEVRDQLLAEYDDVDSDRCTHDLLQVLTDLRAASLIDVQEAE